VIFDDCLSDNTEDFSMNIDASTDLHLPDFVPAELVITATSSHIPPASQGSYIPSTPLVTLPLCPPSTAMSLSFSQQESLPIQSNNKQLTLYEPTEQHDLSLC
jgi:hypothetical protein